jgi:TRAP-type C4-dicarboxylate transport system permease small subunit
MSSEGLWLGSMREPVRLAMIAFTGVAVALYVWLFANVLIFEDAINMFDMIRPEGRIIVWVMLISMAGAVLFASIYLSDTKGAIEQQPEGFFDILSLVTSRLAMIMICFVVIVMFFEVVSRYVFARPTLWANELSLWIAGFVFLFAGQYAMQQRSHIRIYVIYDMMPRWMQKSSDVVSLLLLLFFTFALVWGGYSDAMRRMMRLETFGTAWDPPLPGTLKPAILIIIVLVAIQAISNLFADWNKAPEHHTPADEIDEDEINKIRKTLED